MNNFNRLKNTGLYSFFAILALLAFTMTSCGDEAGNDARDAVDTNPVPTSTTPTMNETPQQNTTAGATGDVQHYTCPNNDGGGSAVQGVCDICGTALVHNAAFHSQGTDNTAPNININQDQAPTPAETPAQNSAGVYHYTCPDGHAGGSGTQGVCSECGAALVHNQAYHQQ